VDVRRGIRKARKSIVRLAVGDTVVYRSHGAGHVTARESRVVLGARQDVVLLALAGGLRVELPLDRAHHLLRPLASESDLSRVQETLGADQAVSNDTWLNRQRETRAKLADGDPVGLAHIIRDSVRRTTTRSSKGAKLLLSPWEREIATRARRLLSTEIALVRGVEVEEADKWIDRHLRQEP
jgi:CarD family transcriptional regulator, regulator of rRNA transcription